MNYLEQKNGALQGVNITIPANHPFYQVAIDEVEVGESTIDYWAGSQRESDYNAAEADKANAKTCTKLRMLEELASLGKEDDLFEALDGSAPMMRRWNAASELRVDHPMVATMAAVLGYSSEQMQVVFNNASKRD